MKQIMQSYRSGELWLAEIPVPALKSGGVLVRTTRSLVSAGTEKMIMSLAKKSLIGKAKARPDLVKQVIKKMKTEGFKTTLDKVFTKLDEPISLGYSAAGVVLETGREAAAFQVGDRVAVAGAGYATHAEFNYVPKNLCVKIPDGVSDDDAAFTTVGSIAMQGVRQTDPKLGERIVVIGLGLLGLLTVQILKANGCAVMGVDLDFKKVQLAKELGADVAVCDNALEACNAFTDGRGADAVVITAATSSNAPIETAADMARIKGRVVVVGLVGMNIPRDPYYKKELDLRLSMSYGPGRYDAAYEEGGQDYPFHYVRFTEQRNMESFLYLVEQGVVTPSKLVTHDFPFDDALDAYALLEGKLPESSPLPRQYLGIMLSYPHDAQLDRRVSLEEIPAHNQGGRVGLGFIGAGGFAKAVLLPALKKMAEVDLTGVCTASGMSGTVTAKKYSFSFATTDISDILSHDATQAVCIVTPHNSHCHLACQVIRSGKHVFIEKPLCLTKDELRQYEDALTVAREAGHAPCIMVGFNRRFSPHAEAIRDFFAHRETPMVVTYRINAGRIPPEHWIQDPNIGGGRILGEGCHFVDFCQSLIGSRPTRVHAMSIASSRRDVVAQDSIQITIAYEDGSLASIQYLAEGDKSVPKERCEVSAGGKTALMDNFRKTDFFGGRSMVKGSQQKGFVEELDAFLAVVRDGGDWPISWQCLGETQQVCLSVLQSLETGESICL